MTEIQFDLSNLNIFLLIGLILLIGGYLYYEIHKIKQTINEIKYHLSEKSYEDNNILLSSTQDQLNIYNELPNEPPNESTNESPNEPTNKSPNEIPNEPSDEPSDEPLLSDQTIQSRNNEWDTINSIMNDTTNDITNNITNDTTNDITNDITNDTKEIKETTIDNLIDEINNDTKIIETDYNSMTISQLKKILSELNLPISGNKTKLIQRIKENKSLEIN